MTGFIYSSGEAKYYVSSRRRLLSLSYQVPLIMAWHSTTAEPGGGKGLYCP